MTLLDIIETYNYTKGNELYDMESFFEDIELDSRLDKSVLIGTLIDECGALTCLYNTTGTFKYFSNLFFKRYKQNIKELIDTMEFEYDPLKNMNLTWTETTNIEQNLDTEESTDETRSKVNTGTVTDEFSDEYSDTETNTVSAMNSQDYEPDNKSETSGDRSNTNVKTNELSEAITAGTERAKGEDLTWNETDTHTESGTKDVIYQDLIEKQRRVIQFNIYDWIKKRYRNELFLLVY